MNDVFRKELEHITEAAMGVESIAESLIADSVHRECDDDYTPLSPCVIGQIYAGLKQLGYHINTLSGRLQDALD